MSDPAIKCTLAPCQERPFGFGTLRPPVSLKQPLKKVSRREAALLAFLLDNSGRRPDGETVH
jgi:hypothetical protein